MSERYCQHMLVAHTCSRCRDAGRMESLRVQLAAAEKERDRFKELLDAPPYVDCICPGCPREVPHAWAAGMCEPCANDDCEHTDGAKAVTEERDALAARVAQLEEEADRAAKQARAEGYAQGLDDAQDMALIVGDDLSVHTDSAAGRMLAAARREGREEGYAAGHAAGYGEGLERGREVEDADATDVAVHAHGMGQKDGLREGREEERRDVVEWLRWRVRVVPDGREAMRFAVAARAIEAGQHIGAAAKEGE